MPSVAAAGVSGMEDELKSSVARQKRKQPSMQQRPLSHSHASQAISSPTLSPPSFPSAAPSSDLTPAQWSAVSDVYGTVANVASTLHSSLRPFLSSLSSAPPSSCGHSLLDVKVQSTVHYLVRLLHLLRLRLSGDSIAAEPSVDELCELRIVLERIRPLEKAVAYSIDRLLSTTATPSAPVKGRTTAKADPLSYRPNPLDLLPSSALPSSTRTPAAAPAAPAARTHPESPPASPTPAPSSPSASALYRPPHHIPSAPLRERRRGAGVSARSSRLAQALSAELSNGPEEIRHEGVGYGEMNERAASDDERVEYEERMMVRLIDTKADKKKRKERERRKALEDVDDYDDLRKFVDNAARPRREQAEPFMEEGGDRKRQRGRRGGEEQVDDLFDGIERGEGPRKRGKFAAKGGKGSKKGAGKKGKGGGRRRF